MEKKLITAGEVKFAAADDETGARVFSGYGAVFGNVDSYGDVIAKGAFKKTIKSGELPLLFLNHDPLSLPIGKWTKLEEDEFGLKAEGFFLDTQAGRDAYTAAKSGAITGLSIGFRPVDVHIGKQNTDEPRRTLKSVDLLEISVVTFPANGKARIGNVKSMESEDDFLRELKRLGLDEDDAAAFLSGHASRVEAKYKQAADVVAAKTLLSNFLGE